MRPIEIPQNTMREILAEIEVAALEALDTFMCDSDQLNKRLLYTYEGDEWAIELDIEARATIYTDNIEGYSFNTFSSYTIDDVVVISACHFDDNSEASMDNRQMQNLSAVLTEMYKNRKISA